MKEPSELIISLTVEANEALDTLAKVKAELEDILALEKEIADLKVQVSERPVTINVSVNPLNSIEKITEELVKGLEKASLFHTL